MALNQVPRPLFGTNQLVLKVVQGHLGFDVPMCVASSNWDRTALGSAVLKTLFRSTPWCNHCTTSYPFGTPERPRRPSLNKTVKLPDTRHGWIHVIVSGSGFVGLKAQGRLNEHIFIWSCPFHNRQKYRGHVGNLQSIHLCFLESLWQSLEALAVWQKCIILASVLPLIWLIPSW